MSNKRKRSASSWDKRAIWLRQPFIRRTIKLDRDRAANRVRAYLYGNILVLAALVALTPENIESGRGVILVIGTTATTFVAHLVAEVVSDRVRVQKPGSETALRHELRDALPIASSGALPSLILVTAWLGWTEPTLALIIADASIIVRFVILGSVLSFLTDSPSSWRSFLSGVSLAIVALLVAVLKIVLTH